jgi:hypothetical protein
VSLSNLHAGVVVQSEEASSQTEISRSEFAKAVSEPDLKGLLLKLRELEKEKEDLRTQVWKDRKAPSRVTGYALLGTGALCLLLSVVLTSTIIVLIGPGLTFWGALLLFIRPQNYVRSDVADSTALSSLKTIDRVMADLGYTEKGVYMAAETPEKAVVFIPAEPLTRVPRLQEIEKQTFTTDPKGITMVPPGLTLANLIERELGVEFRGCDLKTLSKRLPKLLIEGLEMVKDFEMQVDGNNVRFKIVESVYSDFCKQLRESTMVCSSLGCPICSALACVIAMASGKPVSFEKDAFSADGRTIESFYRILEA